MVLLTVTLARHLELASKPVHQFAHAAFGEILGGAPGDPFLCVASLAEVASFEFAGELLGIGARHGRRAGSCPLALEQPFDPFGHHFVTVGENRLAANSRDFFDLPDGMVVLGNKAHHE